jgi:hypothetical protein
MDHPTLDLSEQPGPVLKIDGSDLGSLAPHEAPWLAATLFAAIGALSIAAIVATKPDTQQSVGLLDLLREAVHRIVGERDDGAEESDPARAARDAQSAAAQASTAQPASGIFANSEIAPLRGKYCTDYMPDGTDPAARQAFTNLVWGKLDQQLQSIIVSRLEVCTPFEALSEEVASAGGCQKSSCGIDDATFYIDKSGKAAVEYRVKGRCESASENGFSEPGLLCRQ